MAIKNIWEKKGMKSQLRKKAITVIQVAWVGLIIAVVGGIYGFYTGGPINMIVVFFEGLIIGFILAYVCASFIELSRK
jgi:LytS/YehU family sensor histidine kinase